MQKLNTVLKINTEQPCHKSFIGKALFRVFREDSVHLICHKSNVVGRILLRC